MKSLFGLLVCMTMLCLPIVSFGSDDAKIENPNVALEYVLDDISALTPAMVVACENVDFGNSLEVLQINDYVSFVNVDNLKLRRLAKTLPDHLDVILIYNGWYRHRCNTGNYDILKPYKNLLSMYEHPTFYIPKE